MRRAGDMFSCDLASLQPKKRQIWAKVAQFHISSKKNRIVFFGISNYFSSKGVELELKYEPSIVKAARELETGKVEEHHGCAVPP